MRFPAGSIGRGAKKHTKIARVSGSLKLTARDEKDLSTPQSATPAHARVSGPDGVAGRTQYLETAARQRSLPAHGLDSAEAAPLIPQAREFAFRATDRLHRRSEFLRTQRSGFRAQTTHFVIYAAPGASTRQVRLGITVARAIGNAVARNRVKRLVREAFRRAVRQILPLGSDLLVVARRGAAETLPSSLRAELLEGVRSAGRRLASS